MKSVPKKLDRSMRSSSMLVRIAVKMVHKMKFHLNPDMTATATTLSERARLFWITYILDRNLAVLNKEPYLLHDEDIEIDIPGVHDLDRPGSLMDHTGWKRISIFEFRISLAAIQGMSYKLMSPVRAIRMSAIQRESEIRTLDARIMNWYALVPEYFRAGNVKSLDDNLSGNVSCCTSFNSIAFLRLGGPLLTTAFGSSVSRTMSSKTVVTFLETTNTLAYRMANEIALCFHTTGRCW